MHNFSSHIGLLLVGHGTNSALGTRQFLDVAAAVAQRLAPVAVEPAFLELQQPDIAAGISRLAERGVNGIVVVPLLLFAAGHAKRDIPRQVAAAAEAQSRPLQIVAQAKHLGCHPAVVELSRLRFRQALGGKSAVSADKTALVLVGRGSYDESATAEMHHFARLRHEPLAAATTEVAFLAMARPLLSDLLPGVATGGIRRIVVQPHLLFEGELVDILRQIVANTRHEHPGQEWLIGPALADSQDSATGGNELLLTAICERFHEATRDAGIT